MATRDNGLVIRILVAEPGTACLRDRTTEAERVTDARKAHRVRSANGPTLAAVVHIRLRQRFASVANEAIAVCTIRITARDRAGTVRATCDAVRDRADRLTRAAVRRVGLEVDLSPVTDESVAVQMRCITACDRTGTVRATCDAVRDRAGVRARTAVRRVSLQSNLAPVTDETVAVCAIRITARDRAGTVRASGDAVSDRTDRLTRAAMRRVGLEIDLATIADRIVAVRVVRRTHDTANPVRTRRRAVRPRATHLAASAAVVRIDLDRRFTAVLRITVAIRKTGQTTRNSASAVRATGYRVRNNAGGLTRSAVKRIRFQVHLASVRDRVVAIRESSIANHIARSGRTDRR